MNFKIVTFVGRLQVGFYKNTKGNMQPSHTYLLQKLELLY